LAGIPGLPRQVGYALAALPDESGVPWHRVINAKGEVSPRADRFSEGLQRAMLESEGIPFDPRRRVALARYQWRRGR
jgi:methylated-DNA-protein-cysteine methyltransferase-like protein